MTPTVYDPAACFARLLPSALAYALARAFARAFWWASRARRRAVRANLERVLPSASARERERVARRTFEAFAESLVDSWREGRACEARRDLVTIDGEEHVRDALARGRGVLVWSAHVGNWELAGRALARRGYDVAAIARPHVSHAVERWFERARADAGVRVVARCPGAREARRVLRERGLLALLGDRRFGTGGRDVALFGRIARLPAAPIALAARTGAALVPGFVVRESPGRYRIRFEPAIIASPERALERLAATLERWVRAHPEQWFVFEPVWDDARTDQA
jgi:KDO2-lipid IV(A) lauroyltransferase